MVRVLWNIRDEKSLIVVEGQMTLERQCLLSMYVESFEGVVNVNLRLEKKKTVRKPCVCVCVCVDMSSL